MEIVAASWTFCNAAKKVKMINMTTQMTNRVPVDLLVGEIDR
jgi:hypothetical protein